MYGHPRRRGLAERDIGAELVELRWLDRYVLSITKRAVRRRCGTGRSDRNGVRVVSGQTVTGERAGSTPCMATALGRVGPPRCSNQSWSTALRRPRHACGARRPVRHESDCRSRPQTPTSSCRVQQDGVADHIGWGTLRRAWCWLLHSPVNSDEWRERCFRILQASDLGGWLCSAKTRDRRVAVPFRRTHASRDRVRQPHGS